MEIWGQVPEGEYVGQVLKGRSRSEEREQRRRTCHSGTRECKHRGQEVSRLGQRTLLKAREGTICAERAVGDEQEPETKAFGCEVQESRIHSAWRTSKGF